MCGEVDAIGCLVQSYLALDTSQEVVKIHCLNRDIV